MLVETKGRLFPSLPLLLSLAKLPHKTSDVEHIDNLESSLLTHGFRTFAT